jgi:hypothetical protein
MRLVLSNTNVAVIIRLTENFTLVDTDIGIGSCTIYTSTNDQNTLFNNTNFIGQNELGSENLEAGVAGTTYPVPESFTQPNEQNELGSENLKVFGASFTYATFEKPNKVTFTYDNLSNVLFAGCDIARIRFGDGIKWGGNDGFTIIEEEKVKAEAKLQSGFFFRAMGKP